MKKLPLLLSLSALTAIGCAPRVDWEAEREALRQADAEYSRLVTEKNVEGWVALYTSDATMYPPNEAAVSGIDNVRKFGSQFTALPGFAATFHPLQVKVSSGGDLGYTLNHAVITVTGPDGKPVTEQIRDFHVWRKQADGSWKVVIDIWNSEQPAAPAPTR